jgi:hypothetical protein
MFSKTPQQNEIKAEEIQVKDLFGEKFFFSIPIYQRPFSWTIENFDLLFDDIAGAFDNQQDEYFLGSILLQETEKNIYDIVDGQQRLTSLALLLAVIRDTTTIENLRESIKTYLYQREDIYKEVPERMRITPWDNLRDLFKTYIYEVGGTTNFFQDFGAKIKYKDWEDPVHHLWEALYTFQNKIKERNDIKELVKYLLTKVYFVYIKTSDRSSAFRLFSVLNSRGLALDPVDLLKSDSLSEIDEPSKRVNYAQKWRKIEDTLGREELNNLIAYVRTMNAKTKAQLGMYDEFKKLFKEGKLAKGASFVDYLDKINIIYQNQVLDEKIDINNLKLKNEYKVIVGTMVKFVPFSDWIPVLLSFLYKFYQTDSSVEFLKFLERKIIVEWAVGKTPTERITSLNKVIQLIDENENSQEVFSKLLADNSEQTKSQFVSKLNDNGFYYLSGGKLAKYLLLVIDRQYWELENFDGYIGTVTVEHILPQTPDNKSEWYLKFNEEQRANLINSLGNLTLLSQRKNSAAQNYEFSKKKNEYFGPRETRFKITQKLKDYPEWTVDSINERQKEFVQILTSLYFPKL